MVTNHPSALLRQRKAEAAGQLRGNMLDSLTTAGRCLDAAGYWRSGDVRRILPGNDLFQHGEIHIIQLVDVKAGDRAAMLAEPGI